MRPHTSYLICATCRSGSFLLCEALKNTGLAGVPGEYYWVSNKVSWRKRWGVSTEQEYFEKSIEYATTPNGVFGAKIMVAYFADFVSKIRQLPQIEDTSMTIPKILSSAFPNLHYIWITRRNKIRQAVSLEMAIQTGSWRGKRKLNKKPKFNFNTIDHIVQQLVVQEAAWQEYFTQWNIVPFIVVYEDLVQTYEETALKILKYLDISVPEDLEFGERRLIKQADELSEKWVQWYWTERGFVQSPVECPIGQTLYPTGPCLLPSTRRSDSKQHTAQGA